MFKSKWSEHIEQEEGSKVFIVCGALDKGSTPEMSKALHALIDGSTLKIVENAAHLVMFTHFELIIDNLLKRQ